MILTKEVEIRIAPASLSHYIKLGYDVKINDNDSNAT